MMAWMVEYEYGLTSNPSTMIHLWSWCQHMIIWSDGHCARNMIFGTWILGPQQTYCSMECMCRRTVNGDAEGRGEAAGRSEEGTEGKGSCSAWAMPWEALQRLVVARVIRVIRVISRVWECMKSQWYELGWSWDQEEVKKQIIIKSS